MRAFEQVPALDAIGSLIAGTSLNLLTTLDGGVSLIAVAADASAPAPPDIQAMAHMPPPVYPPQALKARIEGLVMLRVQLAADGTPLQVQPDSERIEPGTDPRLVASALEAVREWRFAPPAHDADARGETWVRVPIEFRLTAPATEAPSPVPPAHHAEQPASGRESEPAPEPAPPPVRVVVAGEADASQAVA